jgi:flavin reductase (DIM6/NTAB) family NADH-FMN oxidoreductase RutF
MALPMSNRDSMGGEPGIMKRHAKRDYPLIDIRRHLETGPIVLVSSAWQGKTNIMTMGWHMMLQFTPALFGCYIWTGNHSYGMIRQSRQCVINVPTVDLIDTIVAIGNSSGSEIDKFREFDLSAGQAEMVKPPLIDECYASFECELADDTLVPDKGLFIWQVVKAHVAPSPRNPKTVHYRGNGEFMVAGPSLSRRSSFKPEML